jgi:hypothetical protein
MKVCESNHAHATRIGVVGCMGGGGALESVRE